MRDAIEEECEQSRYSAVDIAEDWHRWCRLCAEANAENVNIFHEDKTVVIQTESKLEYNSEQISKGIRKYFDVDINHEDQLPVQLCTDCLSLIISLLNFNNRVIKVQQIYIELQQLNDNKTVQDFRLKYGVLENDQPHDFMQRSLGEILIYEDKQEIEEEAEAEAETVVEMLNEKCTAIEIKVENLDEEFISLTDEDVCDVEMLEDAFGNDDDDDADIDVVYVMSDEHTSQINDKASTESNYSTRKETAPPSSSITEADAVNDEENDIEPYSSDEKTITTLSNQDKSGKAPASNRTANNEKLPTKEVKDVEPYSCDQCTRVFKVFASYRSHMMREHGETTVETKYSCSQCAISFNTKTKLRNHHYKKHQPLTVRQTFQCPHCEQKMASKQAKEQHIRFVHKNERSVICEGCGTAVRTKSELKKHMLVHTEDATFECEICEKRFKSRERLKKHSNIHSSAKYICAECGLELKSRITLNNHFLVHSDIRPYKCDYCEKTFKRTKDLKNHLILHTGLKLYSCDFCDKSYPQASNLRGHKKKMHPEELAAFDALGEKPYAKNIPKLAVLKKVLATFFLKDEQDVVTDGETNEHDDKGLTKAISKYFNVEMNMEEQLPIQLCTDCFSLINSLIKFNERVIKVQQMYDDLRNEHRKSVVNLAALRLKYGALENQPTHQFMYRLLTSEQLFAEKLKEHEQQQNNFVEANMEMELQEEQHNGLEIKRENSNYVAAALNDEYVCDFEDGDVEGDDPFGSDVEVDDAELKGKAKSNSIQIKRDDDIKCGTSLTNSNLKEKAPIDENSTKEAFPKKEKKTARKPVTAIATENRKEKKPYTCKECSKDFQIFAFYRAHMKREHAIINIVPQFNCTVCQTSFNTQTQLNQHHTIKHRPITERRVVPCPSCEKMFSTKVTMERHVKFVHMNERLFICEECGEALRTKDQLNQHLLTHSDYAPYECEICKKCFKHPQRLKDHMESHNPNKHICAECGLQLNSRTTLNRHLLVHSDVMRHKCDYCGRAFKRGKALKNHLILHTGLKPYSCDFCDKTFANGSNCRSHKRKHHPVELAAQEAAGEKTYTKNVPKLALLKSVTQAAENLAPVVSKQSGNFAFGKKYKSFSDSTDIASREEEKLPS